jgi:hypothetical protein
MSNAGFRPSGTLSAPWNYLLFGWFNNRVLKLFDEPDVWLLFIMQTFTPL